MTPRPSLRLLVRVAAFFSLALLWTGLAPAAEAPRFQLAGEAVEGGLVFGNVEPGSQVALAGEPVAVDGDGRFVVGFSRDEPEQVPLSVLYPDGTEARTTLDVTQRTYDVQRIDGLPESMVTPPEEVLERIREENEKIWAARLNWRPAADYRSGFIWPALGTVTGVYGSQRILNGKPRQPHFGIDIAAPTGTVVRAPADGVVTLAENDLYYTGGTLIVDHGHGLTSAFLHLSEVSVAVGDEVRQGDPIARVGSTGRSTGAHLDWRINWLKARIDPMLVAGPMPKADTPAAE